MSVAKSYQIAQQAENDVKNKTNNVIDFPSEFEKVKNGDIEAIIALKCLEKTDEKLSPEDALKKFLSIYRKLQQELQKNKINKGRKIPSQTVFDDYIICLEDGKKMQMLNRHLKVKYNMTFQQYKEKWGLPIDYPSTCKNYSKLRANIATGKRVRKTAQDTKNSQK